MYDKNPPAFSLRGVRNGHHAGWRSPETDPKAMAVNGRTAANWRMGLFRSVKIDALHHDDQRPLEHLL